MTHQFFGCHALQGIGTNSDGTNLKKKTELYSTNHHRCTQAENPGGGGHIFAKIPEGARISLKIAGEGPLFWVLLHAFFY